MASRNNKDDIRNTITSLKKINKREQQKKHSAHRITKPSGEEIELAESKGKNINLPCQVMLRN